MGILLVVSGRLKSTYPEFATVQFLNEASLIGGLADWFAVVALFRHPFARLSQLDLGFGNFATAGCRLGQE
jgi:Protein of unknown function (DUF445)